METGSNFLRMMAENMLKIGTAMIDEANRLDGIEIRGNCLQPFPNAE